MENHTIEAISDAELERLAVIMANNPEALDRLATKLAEKVGDKIFDAGFDLTGINESLARIESKLESHDRRFDTIDHNFHMLGEKVDLTNREMRKVNDRIDSTSHLGINTDTRKRDLRIVD